MPKHTPKYLVSKDATLPTRLGGNEKRWLLNIIKLTLLLGLLAKIKVLGVLPAHFPLVLDAGTVLVSVPPLSCTGLVCCHCTRSWLVLDNTHSKDSSAFR